MLQCRALPNGWIRSRLEWIILFASPDPNLDIHMLRCGKRETGKGREERREAGLWS